MKKEKILLICLPILCAVAVIIGYLKVINNTNEDALKFKEEYEEFNGIEINEDLKYSKLTISEDNTI